MNSIARLAALLGAMLIVAAPTLVSAGHRAGAAPAAVGPPESVRA